MPYHWLTGIPPQARLPDDAPLPRGTRVRFRPDRFPRLFTGSPLYALDSPEGTILWADAYGFFLVEPDRPAREYSLDGRAEPVSVLRLDPQAFMILYAPQAAGPAS